MLPKIVDVKLSHYDSVCLCPECGHGVYHRDSISLDMAPPILSDSYDCNHCNFGFSVSSWEGFSPEKAYSNRISPYGDFAEKYQIRLVKTRGEVNDGINDNSNKEAKG